MQSHGPAPELGPGPSHPRTRGRLRVGHIQFLNCLPLYWGLVSTGAVLDVDLVKATPDHLNDALVDGNLDVGPISLVPYLQHADELVLLPDLAVGSDGDVQSVLLLSTVPPEELTGRTVALGSTSRTSVLLARMLLADRYGAEPTYVDMPPDLTTMLLEADAAVLIGDPALRARYAALRPGSGLHVVDLGAAWKQWTGLPMVFAVWAARREVVEQRGAEVRALHRAFLASRDLANANIDVVAERAARYESLPGPALAEYFRTLDFSLGERQLAGVAEFARRASLLGAVPEPCPPTFLQP